MAKVAVTEMTPGDDAAWDQFVAAAYGGTAFHTAAYHRSLAEVTGGRAVFIGAVKGSEIVGGVPLLIYRSAAGEFVNNRLLLHYNGLVLARRLSLDRAASIPQARDSSERIEVVSKLEAAIAAYNFGSVTLHQAGIDYDLRPFHLAGWRSAPTYTYIMPLFPESGADISRLLSAADKNIRRLVRKAGDNGLTVTEDLETSELYRLHRSTAERKGAPLYLPQDQFDTLIRRLHAASICRVFQARLADGTIIAAEVVMVGPGRDSHAVCAAADPQHQALGINPFLRFGVFERLQASGIVSNDLTNASLDTVGKFKAELGAELRMNCVLTSRLSAKYRLNQLRHQLTGSVRRLPEILKDRLKNDRPKNDRTGSVADRPAEEG